MACRVVANQHGRLALSLHWRRKRSWEGTGLANSREHRQQLQRVADAITAEIRNKQFTPERYLFYFPEGNRAAEFRKAPSAEATRQESSATQTVRGYFDVWIKRQQPPLVRPALARDYRQHLTRYVLSTMVTDVGRARVLGEIPLTELKTLHLLDLRQRLLDSQLKLKTVRNIMDGSFRAMMRDARTVDLILTVDPFAAIRWPRSRPPIPDPFMVDERDRILAWFKERRPFYLPFIFTLFHTGMRPSEAVALRWRDVDVTGGTIRISRSAYLGAEGPTKTAASERTIRVVPALRDILRQLMPLHVGPSDHVFTNAKNGGPIDQSEWPKDHWRTALRATSIRPRKFYATRHTFISVGLTRGLNPKFLAEYCGTSVAMIEKDYGRFLNSEVESQLRLLAEPAPTTPRRSRVALGGAKPSTPSPRLTVGAEKPLWSKASPTGFEPVLPA